MVKAVQVATETTPGKEGTMIPPVWEGVYDSFAQAAGNGGVFDGDIWMAKVEDRLNRDLARLEAGAGSVSIPALAQSRDHPLSMVVAMIEPQGRPLRVVDFGGGLASAYLTAIASLPPGFPIDYHIVETEAVCAAGRRRLADRPGLRFHTALPPDLGPVDLIIASSALHYVEDWRGMLARFADLRPRYLLFCDLPVGDIPTFVTAQRFHDSRIPVWFWNFGMFVAAVEGLGPRLLWRSRYSPNGTDLPMDALPPEYRLRCGCHLLFRAGCFPPGTPLFAEPTVSVD